jgi:hypothetical protein
MHEVNSGDILPELRMCNAKVVTYELEKIGIIGNDRLY